MWNELIKDYPKNLSIWMKQAKDANAVQYHSYDRPTRSKRQEGWELVHREEILLTVWSSGLNFPHGFSLERQRPARDSSSPLDSTAQPVETLASSGLIPPPRPPSSGPSFVQSASRGREFQGRPSSGFFCFGTVFFDLLDVSRAVKEVLTVAPWSVILGL